MSSNVVSLNSIFFLTAIHLVINDVRAHVGPYHHAFHGLNLFSGHQQPNHFSDNFYECRSGLEGVLIYVHFLDICTMI